MRELLLGLRLLMGSGRGNRVRFVLMTLGSAVGVACLAAVLAIPGILAAQDARMAAREPTCDTDAYGRCLRTDAAALTLLDPLGSRPMTRVFIAPGSEHIPPPPGLDTLPQPGDLFVSPLLHDALRRERGLSQLLPGKESGIIGPRGLAHPDELYAYVGVPGDKLKNGHALTSFGEPYPSRPTVEDGTLDIVRFTLAGVVLLPLAVFLSVCARLSAAARTRRLAALRLLGLSTKGVQRVNAGETVAAAVLGAALGLSAYELINQMVSRVGLPGFKWYPSDGTLTLPTVLVCLVGCPVLAWFVGRASARKAARNPLAVRRSAVEKPPNKWGLLPLVPGLGIVIGYCVAGAMGHAPQDTEVSSVLMPLAVVLLGAGLVMSLPVFSRALARRIARGTGSLTLGLAMRRNEVEPGGALRVATGLVLLVYAASLVQGVLIELDQVTKYESPVQIYNVPLDGMTGQQLPALPHVEGVRAHVIEGRAEPVSPGDGSISDVTILIATCGQMRAMVRQLGPCEDGRSLRLLESDNGDAEAMPEPGQEYSLAVRNDREDRAVQLKAPGEVLRYRDQPGIGALSADVVVPPSLVPAGFRPASGQLTLLSSPDSATVRGVLDGIGAVDPTIEVLPAGINVDALQQVGIVKTLLAVGMVLGLVIGVAAYLVAAADRAVERRAQVTALALLGARRRTLRAVQVVQVVLPLAVGLLLAVVTGKAAESSYLVTGGGSIFWDGDGVPLLLASAVGAVVVAALGALPLIGRRIDPELIRRD
ncbi:FtsX-like permease family protein [Streptomyces griseosporeus]|uniref:FtsX-like permease family protein n=1 Tax=Streptomyces griseosporeus TaxID=1910 RepID=UPI0036F83B5D